jgi:phosphoribosyl 1,2-cyclic phosphodiesterase
MSAERWHGTAGGYTNHGCRCVECRTACADLKGEGNAVRAERMRRDPSVAEHGRKSTYDNWG